MYKYKIGVLKIYDFRLMIFDSSAKLNRLSDI